MPLYKKGDVNDVNNYRGISLSDISGKLYGSIINQRLHKWVEVNDLTGEHQAGFKRDHSTVDHIFTLLATIQKQFINDKKLYVAFIDFEKAFDSISRNLIWPILRKNGIRGKMLKCVKSMYNVVKAKVRSGAKLTDLSIQCTKGVKQGDVCSPILFSLFVNELALDIIKGGRHGVTIDLIELFILLFADDLVLLSTTIVGLQTQLRNLHMSAERLDLRVNMAKTKVVVFRKGGYLGARERWFYGGESVEVVNAYKYLGIYFSTRLSFTVACRDLVARAKNAVIRILKILYKFENNSVNVFFKLFDAQVQPIFQYGAEIWGLDKCNDIEKVHIFAMKRFLQVSTITPNDIVYGELGRYPVYINSYLSCIRYWLKIINMDDKRLPKKCYKMLVEYDNKGKVNWVTNIRRFLCNHGYLYVWNNQSVGDINAFLKCLKQRLVDCRWQDWHSHIHESDRFSLYRLFKTSNCVENHLFLNVNKYITNALIKFRCGVSCINVHYKRFQKNFDYKCRLCNIENEDEIHVLLVCPNLADIRTQFLGEYYQNSPSQDKMLGLLKSKNESILKNLSIFIYFALKRYEDTDDANRPQL